MRAIESLLSPTEESIWRSFSRAYSERWHVPLPQVRAMDPLEVIGEVLEARYEDVDAFEEIEGILEDIYKIESPQYEVNQKANMKAFIKNIEKREKKRLEAEKKKEEKRIASFRKEPPKKGGSVDFSGLKNDK